MVRLHKQPEGLARMESALKGRVWTHVSLVSEYLPRHTAIHHFTGGTVPMYLTRNLILQSITGAAMAIAVAAVAQTPATPAPDAAPAAPAAQAPAPAPAAAPAAPTWSVGPMDISGLIDGYYSYNQNRPASNSFAGQVNQLYNFNDQDGPIQPVRGSSNPESRSGSCRSARRHRLWAREYAGQRRSREGQLP